MRKRTSYLSVLFRIVPITFLLLGLQATAQIEVSGTISSSDGMPIPGVNVTLTNTSTGTTTDFNGFYTISVPDQQAVLSFSYVGFEQQSLTVGNQTTINVTLEESSESLDQIVVVGYGARKKSDITGAVSSVKAEEINAFPVLNAEQGLQGRAAGVAVQSNNGGEPGAPISVRVRGNTSLGASSAALIVVDGFVGASLPQASDIASMEVLKDASATAIYGSRGSGGVILVTTKKGKSGKMNIEVNSSYSSQSVTEQLDLLNAEQFAAYNSEINNEYVQGNSNTDWQDLIYQTGYVSNHQLSFAGGSEKIKYYVSGNYFDQNGVVINSGFERFSFLNNIDIQATEKLKVGFSAYGNRSKKNGVSTQANSGGRGSGDVISIAYRFAPDLGVLDGDGLNTVNVVGDDVDNPVAIANESVDEARTDDYRANFFGEYELIEGLKFKTTIGFSTVNRTRGIYKPSTLIATAGNQGGIAEIKNLKTTDVLSENYLTYNKQIGEGKLSALAGYSYQKIVRQENSAKTQGLISDRFTFNNLGGGIDPQIPTSELRETEILSQYGRLNYDYGDRYLLTATVRRDGSSNFAKNEKFAVFPSFALGWKISNESFLKENETLSNLKLRGSWGQTGNPSINPYQSLASLNDIYAVVGDQTVAATVPNQLENPDLKWETSVQTNFGIDFGFINNRITFSADYYNIDTKDLILGDSSNPEISGFANLRALKNVGEINNKGIELALSTKNVSTDNFSWSTDINWSTNKNKITRLVDGKDIFLDSSPGSFLQDETHLLREGEPVGVFYGYEFRGVNQGGVLPEGTSGFTKEAGEELFTDFNGDGEIDDDDRVIIGDPNPDWIAGINNNFTYKNFDLNVFFQASVGGDIFSYTLLELASGGSNATTEALNRWTPTNTNTNVPSAKVREKLITDRFVYDGSYVRLKNLSLGYNLPKDVVSQIGMEKIRVSISGQNLLTFTDFPGTDPEASYQSSGDQSSGGFNQGNVNQGFDYGSYPNIKAITFGVNLKF